METNEDRRDGRQADESRSWRLETDESTVECCERVLAPSERLEMEESSVDCCERGQTDKSRAEYCERALAPSGGCEQVLVPSLNSRIQSSVARRETSSFTVSRAFSMLLGILAVEQSRVLHVFALARATRAGHLEDDVGLFHASRVGVHPSDLTSDSYR